MLGLLLALVHRITAHAHLTLPDELAAEAGIFSRSGHQANCTVCQKQMDDDPGRHASQLGIAQQHNAAGRAALSGFKGQHHRKVAAFQPIAQLPQAGELARRCGSL